MIYLFIEKNNFNKEMLKDVSIVSDLEDYKVLRFENVEEISKELDRYKRFNQETYKSVLVDIINGKNVKITKKDYDDTGREVVRYAATDKGWAYLAQGIEFTTAKENSVYCKNWKGEDFFENQYIKFYDDQDQEVSPENAVKTKVTIDPGLDYDLIAGSIMQHQRPVDTNGDLVDVRLHTIIGILDPLGNAFDPDGPGTAWSEQVTQFVGPINLKFVTDNGKLETDGRAGKKLFKIVNDVIPFNQNQIQFIIEHPQGFQHDIFIMLQYYREP